MRQAYNELSKRMMVDGGRIYQLLAKNLKIGIKLFGKYLKNL
jgi:hypothetical protein